MKSINVTVAFKEEMSEGHHEILKQLATSYRTNRDECVSYSEMKRILWA